MLVHERVRRLHRGGVVVVAKRSVAGQAHGGRLPATVHGDEVDVDVDQQVGFGGALVDLDFLTLVGGAEEREVVGVFGIVLEQQATRLERVVHAVAEGVAQFELVHPAVQGERGDEVHVVDACVGGHRQHLLDDPLAQVGAPHLRKRKRHVVERNGELHAGEQQRRQRIHVDRIQQRGPDRTVDVVDGVVGLRRVDHTAAVGRQLLQPEAFPVPEQCGRRRAVDVEYESRARHQVSPVRRSKAIFTAPRRPAVAAWAMASTWSDRG